MSLESRTNAQYRPLPNNAKGNTYEAIVGGQKVYLRTQEYEDGTLGAISLDLLKCDPLPRSLMQCFAISISSGLQHGVPLKEYTDKLIFTRSEPQGRVFNDPNIKFATSVIDYVMRRLAADYLGRTDILHVKKE